MVDQKEIAGIFNDFRNLYIGKSELGIRQLLEKYKNHPVLMGLFSNMDEAVKLQIPQTMKEVYDFYKKYRGRELEDKDWENVSEEANRMIKEKDNNFWYRRMVLEMVTLLDKDDHERRQIAKEVEKEMEAAIQEMDAA
ncbi:hypothetical protein [Parablautia sp. Marseille-Q6255]|uniref:hypothetical protein n=1 Tax=Parablautia sp. Marseille-Q6255 TaxID=3039593 RepID=UPI0024BCABE5|nr:hypothetical protein [Parablautia sp. Marseille-Q6255]